MKISCTLVGPTRSLLDHFIRSVAVGVNYISLCINPELGVAGVAPAVELPSPSMHLLDSCVDALIFSLFCWDFYTQASRWGITTILFHTWVCPRPEFLAPCEESGMTKG